MNLKSNVKELKAKELRYYPALAKYKNKTTEDIPPIPLFSFQKRGFEALDFGMEVKKKGFNIYVAGQPGSGKTSNVKKYIEDVAKHLPVPDDLLCVFNFDDCDSPKMLFLKAGSGEKFIKDMEDLLEGFIEQIPRQMESENFEAQRSEVTRDYRDAMDKNYSALESEASKLNFALSSSESGLALNPVVDGKVIDREQYDSLEENEKEKIRCNENALQEKLIAYFHQERKNEKEYKEKLSELQHSTVKKIISEPLKDLRKKYGKNDGIGSYLNSLSEFTINNFSDFFTYRDFLEGKIDPQKILIPDFKEYKVNLLINNKELNGAPVIYETNPTFQNIIGYFEYEESHNSLFTDFTRLKPGALHRANGGFLILQADDILKNYYAWTALKRAVRNRFIKIEDMDADFKYRVITAPNPEAVPLDIKIVLIGDDELYHLLYERDPDFRRIFKVKADFDSIVDVSAASTDTLIGFISSVVNEDCDLPFDLSAIRRLLYYSSRRAEDQTKYSVHAGDIVEIIVEAVYWAQHKKRKVVSEDMVITAIDSREKRYDRFREHYFESIKKGNILIDVTGAKVGQINGLAVYQIGDFSFGIPSRITAKAFAGQREIVNIEREAMLSGAIHDKGAMILAGYLGGLFAVKKPLSFSASIAFEQSYGGVDGDSASSTELYALMSALSDVPIKQSIAVTGSINQMGEIQPIGGVNEKIEGFFEICTLRGLTGDQGVMIPIQNVVNLNLSDDVVKAVEEGKFHIYAIKNVIEGIEILTGVAAGSRNASGKFTKGSLFEKIEQKLETLRKGEK